MKKSVLAVLLFAAPIFAQTPASVPAKDPAAAARAAAGCGPSKIQFEVKTDKNQHPMAQPEAGKALVYVFSDTDLDNVSFHIGSYSTLVGLDGVWVGANGGRRSYLFFPADSGDHRLCTNMQSRGKIRTELSAAATFTAEAGKVYYFRAKTPDHPSQSRQVELAPVDPAAAQLFIAISPFSTSHPKK
jgi:hypothetical protein